jgi:ribosome-associated protein
MKVKRTKSRKKTAGLSQADQLKELIIKSLEDDKAEDIVVIDLAGKADFAHYMIIASGRSSRHITSVADSLVDNVQDFGIHDVHTEGAEKGEWVLIDAIDVVVHLFKPENRTTYDLERMWGFEVKK